MTELFTTENLVALLTLSALEIVLGIDNVVFISILTGKLPEAERPRARQIGLGLAMGSRIALLLAVAWLAKLTAPLFAPFGHELSGRDLILLVGGLFLIGKATWEIHDKLEGAEHELAAGGRSRPSFGVVLAQIIVLDIVFSLDSVITAVGMSRSPIVMIVAIFLAVLVMMIFAGPISAFIERHPTLKMLALSFLLLIGVMLMAEGFGQHIQKGYIYSAMAFSLFVEMLNIRMRRKAPPVQLHQRFGEADAAGGGGAKG